MGGQQRWKLGFAFILAAVILLQQRLTSYHKFKTSSNLAVEVPNSWVESLAIIKSKTFDKPDSAGSSNNSFINIGMIMINIKKTDDFSIESKWKMGRTFRSILDYSSGSPLHLIVVTDVQSILSAARFLSNMLGKYLSFSIIKTMTWRRKKEFPKVEVSYVNIDDIIDEDRDFFNAMKFNSMDQKTKYRSDLFYIAPLYHKAFKKIKRLIFLDSTDLEFYDDILNLQLEFENMGEKLFGVALDMSPHYRNLIAELGGHHQSLLGLPGPKQGLNTGVVLFQLEKMRQSKKLYPYLAPIVVRSLIDKYGIAQMSLGDQDWLTCLSWDHPDLFHILPCQFNRQTDLMYLREDWENVFHQYHNCDSTDGYKIVHRNGCGPTPAFCGNKVSSRNKSLLQDVNLDIEAFWSAISNVKKLNLNSTIKNLSWLLQESMFINCAHNVRDYCNNFSKGRELIEL